MTTPNPVTNKEDFLEFFKKFREDLQKHPEQWENKDLPSFLEAMQTWIEDMDGYYKNTNQPIPKNISWNFFVDILKAASIYE